MKARRQALILDLLGREPVRNQEQLRRGLRAVGVVATLGFAVAFTIHALD